MVCCFKEGGANVSWGNVVGIGAMLEQQLCHLQSQGMASLHHGDYCCIYAQGSKDGHRMMTVSSTHRADSERAHLTIVTPDCNHERGVIMMIMLPIDPFIFQADAAICISTRLQQHADSVWIVAKASHSQGTASGLVPGIWVCPLTELLPHHRNTFLQPYIP